MHGYSNTLLKYVDLLRTIKRSCKKEGGSGCSGASQIDLLCEQLSFSSLLHAAFCWGGAGELERICHLLKATWVELKSVLWLLCRALLPSLPAVLGGVCQMNILVFRYVFLAVFLQ